MHLNRIFTYLPCLTPPDPNPIPVHPYTNQAKEVFLRQSVDSRQEQGLCTLLYADAGHCMMYPPTLPYTNPVCVRARPRVHTVPTHGSKWHTHIHPSTPNTSISPPQYSPPSRGAHSLPQGQLQYYIPSTPWSCFKPARQSPKGGGDGGVGVATSATGRYTTSTRIRLWYGRGAYSGCEVRYA